MLSCDLGSNTIRFVEIDCKTKKRVKEFEKIVKTAEGLKESGKVSNEAVKRVIDAIKEASEFFDFSKGVEAVTTEALRVASNQREILEEIKIQTGLNFKVLSGKEEAFYTNYAVKEKVATKSYTLLDIGGGSTEISIVNINDIYTKSFDLGIVTLSEQLNTKNTLDTKLQEIKNFFASKTLPKTCVVTAGTPTTIASFILGMDYQSYDYRKINGFVLTVKDIENTKKKLLTFSFEERKRWVGVGREDLIINGIDIFLSILKLFDYQECTVIDDGLREGVALYKCYKKFNY